MSGEDIKAIVAAHKANPRQVTTMAVAFCMLRFKAQVGETLRAADLMASLGISDSMARRAVRAARSMAPETDAADPQNHPVEPEDSDNQKRNLTVPAEPHRSGTSPFREPEPHRSASRNLTVPHTNEREKDRERQRERDADALESSEPESGTKPEPVAGTSPIVPRTSPPKAPPDPEHERISDLADQISAGTLGRWASDALKIYPAHHVRAVVERKLPGARPMPQPAYLSGILQRWARGEGSDIPPDPSTIRPPAEVVPFTPRRKVAPPTRRTFDHD